MANKPRTSDPRHILGKAGEILAKEHLEEKGFQVLFRNYKTRYGEIDLIAKDGDYLVFIEVRTKTHTLFGHPLETVNHKKQEKIIRMARMFLAEHEVSQTIPCRFDVVGVISAKGGSPEIIHIMNAFQA